MDNGLEIKIRIEGFNKQVADALIAKTSLVPEERMGRVGWDYTVLRAAGVVVGMLNHNRTNDPLHLSLNLTALKTYDEHWQTTLESLGVL